MQLLRAQKNEINILVKELFPLHVHESMVGVIVWSMQ